MPVLHYSHCISRKTHGLLEAWERAVRNTASELRLWLGDAVPHSSQLFSALHHIWDGEHMWVSSSRVTPCSTVSSRQTRDLCDDHATTDPLTLSLQYLVSHRSYCQRIAVISSLPCRRNVFLQVRTRYNLAYNPLTADYKRKERKKERRKTWR